MASAVPELQLLARDQAFEALYRRYVKDVYHYALALLRNPADAEDVTQTTFMNAYRAYKRGDEIRKPQNWLIKIAHNVARTRYARAGRRVKEVPLDDHVDQLAVPEEERPNIEGVLRALGRLPFNQRAALVMRELEGRSYVEIADTLDVSVSAVETLIFRARKALRLRVSTLRVLTAVPLPGSLSQLFEGSAVVGGGGAVVGTGFLGKAAVALVAGAFATGIGGDNAGPAKAASPGQSLAVARDWTAVTGPMVRKPAAGRKGIRAAVSQGVREGSLRTTGSRRTAHAIAPKARTVSAPAPAGAAPVSGGTAPLGGPVQVAATEAVAKVEEVAEALPVPDLSLPPLPVEVPALPAPLPAAPELP
jgi:RNA polymerase sigma factor (sigma-70 family)